jgi:hypothetical protein
MLVGMTVESKNGRKKRKEKKNFRDFTAHQKFFLKKRDEVSCREKIWKFQRKWFK